MKLHELQSPPSSLLEELNQVWEDRESLDEGIWDTLKGGFTQIGSAFNTIKKNVNQKGELNDRVLRQIYLHEMGEFKKAYNAAPQKVKAQVDRWLEKAGIRMQGADLSRKNFNRIMILKVLRLILFTAAQLRDNGIVWLLSTVVTAGVGNIIGLLLNAKDVKSVGAELVNTSKQLKTLFDNAKDQPPEE